MPQDDQGATGADAAKDRNSNSSSVTGWSLRSLAAGPIAGVVSRLFVYPFDTVKARLQVQTLNPPQYTGTTDALVKVLRADGVPGLYRGFLAAAVGSVPGNLAYFGGYELGRILLKGLQEDSKGGGGNGSGGGGAGTMIGDMAVGAVAQMIGGLVFTPVDVIKERMQVQGVIRAGGEEKASVPGRGNFMAEHSGGARGGGSIRGEVPSCSSSSTSSTTAHQSSQRGTTSREAIRELLRERGVSGLMRGYWATNAVWIPWNMLYMAFYEASKRAAAEMMDAAPASHVNKPGNIVDAVTMSEASGTMPAGELPPYVLALCSAGSASLAAVLTHPIDVVKTRIQVASSSASPGVPEGGKRGGEGFLPVARDLVKKEGLRGALTRGCLARVLTLAPGTALSWAVYEPVKKMLESSS